MNIHLEVDINDSRLSDGLLSVMTVINQVNSARDNNITLDFSAVKHVTPLFVLPL